MNAVVELVEGHWEYLAAGVGAIVGLLVLRRLLNRPIREEQEHAARFEEMKKKKDGQYRDLRPLK
jgi:uncharacterized membrane-anchored protein YhcB (DUF1043 family)